MTYETAKKVQERFNQAQQYELRDSTVPKSDPLSWIQEFTVTQEEVEEYGDPNWIYPNLIIESHILALIADPAAGKTTVCTHIAGELAARGYRVIFALADVGKTDIKHVHAQSVAHGWTLLLPDVKAGQSMEKVVENLKATNEAGGDLTGVILFCDTFKKMVDVISKRHVKALLAMLRQLTAKGMTIVLLAHTNKYKNAEGEPIFEGTHDVMTDVDDLVYLIPKKNLDGTLTTSTKPSHKVRGVFEPITFQIDRERRVSLADGYVDTLAELQRERQREDDQDVIDWVTQALQGASQPLIQSEVIAQVQKEHPVGEKRLRAILKRYSGREWEATRRFDDRNKLEYALK
jgi:hypothetical protein